MRSPSINKIRPKSMIVNNNNKPHDNSIKNFDEHSWRNNDAGTQSSSSLISTTTDGSIVASIDKNRRENLLQKEQHSSLSVSSSSTTKSLNVRQSQSGQFARPSWNRSKRSSIEDTLQMATLRFDSLGLIGREKEMNILHETLKRVIVKNNTLKKALRESKNTVIKDNITTTDMATNHTAAAEIVLLSGNAGAGKSSLVADFGNKCQRQQGAMYAHGKFESSDFGGSANEPLSAIIKAFSQLADESIKRIKHEMQTTDKQVERQRQLSDMLKTLISAIRELANVIPNLLHGITNDDEDDHDIGIDNDNDRRRMSSLKSKEDDISVVSRTATSNPADSKGSVRRFHFLARQFLHLVCSSVAEIGDSADRKNKNGVVMLCLDDLQWADASSLSLLLNLATDEDLHGLLLCLCYRNEEVNESHPLVPVIDEIKRHNVCPVTEITITNLSVDGVNTFLSELLSSTGDQTSSLAKIVHGKTGGNAFFVQQFMSSLEAKKLLTFNVGTVSWLYDVETIREETAVADNIKDFMIDVLNKQLPQETLKVLELASCLGSSFDKAVLIIAVEKLGMKVTPPSIATEEANNINSLSNSIVDLPERHSEDKDDDNNHDDVYIASAVTACLDLCIEKGLLAYEEKRRQYKFVHDHVQRAAYFLSDEHERDLASLKLGEALADGLSSSESLFEEYLFVIVDLWNRGVQFIPLSSCTKRVRLAELNLLAGKKAIEMSAFDPALIYLRFGVDELCKSDMEAAYWADHKGLMVDLYSTLADTEFSCGDSANMQQCIDKILSQQELTLKDKLRAHSTQVRSLGAQNNPGEAVDSSLDLLSKLGVSLPRGKNLKASVLGSLLKTKFLLGKHTTSSLLLLPEMNDFQQITAMRIMDNLLTYAYAINTDLMVVTTLKMVRWSVKYGLCVHSPAVFAVYGMLVTAIFGDSKAGHEYAKFALTLVNVLNAKEVEARTIFIANNFVLHWIDPIRTNLESYRKGYESGLSVGDLENSMLCIIYHCDEATNIGRPLSTVVADLKAYSEQTTEYELGYFHKLTLPLWQFALNMMGESESPVVLTGKAMDQESLLQSAFPNVVCYTQVARMWLAVYFGEYELAISLADSQRDMMLKVALGRHIIWRSALFEGLAAFSLARSTRRRRKWMSRARKVIDRVKKWEKLGNINCVHISCIFQAEKAAIEGKIDDARNKYGQAIATAGKMGFLNDKALFNERAGEFFVQVKSKDDSDTTYWAKHYLENAYKLYADWEAWGKTKHLSRKYAEICNFEDLME